jgi:Metallopeptidase toxin 3
MKMKPEDITRFPKFAKYMKNSMPAVADVPSIRAAFQKYGQIDRATLQRALKWGELPNINIAPDPDNYGTFNGDVDPEMINLDSAMIQSFEDGHGVVLNRWGRGVFLAGAKFLHELIHWADFRDGVDFDGGTEGEEGDEFEKDCYGRVLQEA